MTDKRQRVEGRSWYRIHAKAASGGPTRIDLYDEIGFWGISAQEFLSDLAGIDGPLELHINSPGGEVFDAYAIYNALDARGGVTTQVDGLAASSAALILMAGDERYASELSQVMIHEAWSGGDGNAASMAALAARLETVSAQIAGVFSRIVGGSVEDWRARMQAESWYTADEALDAGLITGVIVSSRADKSLEEPVAASVKRRGDHALVAGVPATGRVEVPDIADADVDNSPWDARKAWANGAAADDKAAFYAGITAGRREGEPADTQAAYALPYRYTPDSAPNAEGVRQALSRLPQAEGLSNADAAKAKLEGLMKDINPDYEPPEDSASAGPVSGTVQTPTTAEPVMASATSNGGGSTMEWTIEARRSRVQEIAARMEELAGEYPAAQFPSHVQQEWDRIVAEQEDHLIHLRSVDTRNAQLAASAAAAGVRQAHMAQAGGFTGDGPRAGSAAAQPGAAVHASPVYGAPAVQVTQDSIYDLAAIRQRARSYEELAPLMRDNAHRAVEVASFPGQEQQAAQTRVDWLLRNVADHEGTIARRILATGSPEYRRVFGRALALGNPAMLSTHDQQILGALGVSTNSGADGGYAVPFELDPSVTLTSDGSINPLRQMADVRQITTKELDLVNTAGVTVGRGTEAQEATDGSPSLTQPTIKPQRVQAFIPFSVEIEGDWAGLQAEMFGLLQDGKDQEEATGANGFVLGDGTAPHAGGLIGTFGTAQIVLTAATATFAVGDVYGLKNSVGPRFRSRGQFLSDSAIYDLVRQFGTGTMANVWTDLGPDRPPTLIGYPARELSQMDTTTASGKKIMVFGDFKTGFLIVDRVGMNMELVPHLFGSSNRYPTGQRGYYVWWRNNSMIRANQALRLLKVL